VSEPVYRAIHLGGDRWVVRKFQDGNIWEVTVVMHFDDPQLRSSDRAVIERAKKSDDWTHQ